LLSQFGEHVNDKKFNFIRVQKAEQDRTDKGDHNNYQGVPDALVGAACSSSCA
jgi:hypothetical protein